MSLDNARILARDINKAFGAQVIHFSSAGDFIDRSIHVPRELIDKYYFNELQMEEDEARAIQQEDAERAGLSADDGYLFYQNG